MRFTSPKSLNQITRRKFAVDLTSKTVIFALSTIAIFGLIAMFAFILKAAVPAIQRYGFFQIYFTSWFEPGSQHFGIWGPLTITIVTSVFATILSWWVSVRSAIFIHYRIKKGQKFARLIVQLLAGIPSIIFGLFAAKSLGAFLTLVFGFPFSDTIFTAIFMLAFMIIPIMTALILNQLKHVSSDSLRGVVSLGKSKTFAIYKVIRKEIKTGIFVAGIVAFGRALGETMAVSLLLSGGVNNPFSKGVFGLLAQSWATLGANLAYWMGSDAATPDLRSALFAAGLSMFFLIMLVHIVIMNVSKKRVFTNQTQRLFSTEGHPFVEKPHNWLFYTRVSLFWITTPFRLIRYVFRFFFTALGRMKTFTSYWLVLLLSRIFLPQNTPGKTSSQYYLSVTQHPSQIAADWTRKILEWVAVTFVVLVIGWIVLDIFVKGSASFHFNDFFTMRKDTVGNSFMFTLLLVEIAIAIAFPLSLAAALYLVEFSKKSSAFNRTIKFFLDSLGGTPSILFGMFGLIFFLHTLHLSSGNYWKVGSVWAAAFTMVLVILPTFTRSIEQTLVRVPDTLREASYSLGASHLETIYKVVIPTAFTGILTGFVLSIGRILSETAPVYLTMGLTSGDGFGPGHPGQTLTSRILYYIIYSPLPPGQASGIAYEAALVTFILVLIITFLVTFLNDIKQFAYRFQYWIFPPKKRMIQNG